MTAEDKKHLLEILAESHSVFVRQLKELIRKIAFTQQTQAGGSGILSGTSPPGFVR